MAGSVREYQPHLDGLRAVAVLAVLCFHIGIPPFSGGFVGVDVFFVISGYFTVGMLLSARERGERSLVSFYRRRVRRLVPAYYALLAVVTVLCVVILFPLELKDYGLTLATAAPFGSNFLFWQQTGYFTKAATSVPLLHTWSLAVEAQFYLVFPMLVLACWRWAEKWLTPILVLGFACSFALSVWGASSIPGPTFFLMPTRAWELGLGVLIGLGVLGRAPNRLVREVAGIGGLILIGVPMVLYARGTIFPGMGAAPPCLGAALIVWAGTDDPGEASLVQRVLSTRALVFIGLISYSLYLWHWPILVLAKQIFPYSALSIPLRLAVVALSFGCAVLSWRYIEQPFRGRVVRQPRRVPSFTAAGAALAVLLVTGAGLFQLQGLPGRFTPEVAYIASKTMDFSPDRLRCHFDGTANAKFAQSCILGARVPPKTIVLGDSLGVEISAALGEAAGQRGESMRQVTASGCAPVPEYKAPRRPECARYFEAILRAVLASDARDVVIAAAHQQSALTMGAERYWAGLEKEVRQLREAGHRVSLIGQFPTPTTGVAIPLAVARWVKAGGQSEAFQFDIAWDDAIAVDARVKEIAERQDATFVPLLPFLCPESKCSAWRDGEAMYFDNFHISMSAARRIVEALVAPVLWPSPNGKPLAVLSKP